MNRRLPLVLLAVLAPFAALVGCHADVPVPGKERIGNFQLLTVPGQPPLSNDCSTIMVPEAGVPIDGGVILSVTYNNTTSPDGGRQLPDGGPIAPYDAGFLTQSDGSGSEYGVIEGQVITVTGDSPRVFPGCNCPSIDPPDILVHERNVLALLSASQRALVVLADGGCPPLEVLLDGGIPVPGGSVQPPRNENAIWSVDRVCGVNQIQIEVLGTTCDAGCLSCSMSSAITGVPVAP